MSDVNNRRLEKYVPVRKLKRIANETVVLQKELLKVASNDEAKTLLSVA